LAWDGQCENTIGLPQLPAVGACCRRETARRSVLSLCYR